MQVVFLKLHYDRFLPHSFQSINHYHYRILMRTLLNKQTNERTDLSKRRSRVCNNPARSGEIQFTLESVTRYPD